MTALNKQALRQLAEKATHGEWWSDVVETEGEYGEGEDRASGYHSYAVYVGSESLLDMTNSTAACIHEEWDHDYHMAWDETAKRNAEFIAAANPATVLALLDELEAAEKLATQQGNIAVALLDEVTTLRRNADDKAPELRAQLIDADNELDTLRQRIAELENDCWIYEGTVKKLLDRAEAAESACNEAARILESGERMALTRSVEILRAAGIGVKGE